MTGRLSGYSASYAAVLDIVAQMAHVTSPEERELLFREELRAALERESDERARADENEEAKEDKVELKADNEQLEEDKTALEKERDDALEKIKDLERALEETPDRSLMATLGKENAAMREELKENAHAIAAWIKRADDRHAEFRVKESELYRIEREYQMRMEEYETALRLFKQGEEAIYLSTRIGLIDGWRLESQRLRQELRDLQADPRLQKPLPRKKGTR